MSTFRDCDVATRYVFEHRLKVLTLPVVCGRTSVWLLYWLLFDVPLAGAMSDAARVHGGSASRRRDRLLRQRLRHERLSIRMCVEETRVMTSLLEPPIPPVLIEYVAPAPTATLAAPAPVIEYVVTAPATSASD